MTEGPILFTIKQTSSLTSIMVSLELWTFYPVQKFHENSHNGKNFTFLAPPEPYEPKISHLPSKKCNGQLIVSSLNWIFQLTKTSKKFAKVSLQTHIAQKFHSS